MPTSQLANHIILFLNYEVFGNISREDQHLSIIVKICQQKNIPVCVLLAGSLAVQKPDGILWPLTFARQRTGDKLFLWGENDKNN